MPSKKVVLCEGVHDLILISLLLEQKGICFDKVTHEELINTRERSPESNKIREFLKPTNKICKYLIKEEGGYSRCVDNFINLYEDKDGDQYAMFLILDSGKPLIKLKNDSVERFRQDIITKQSENFFMTKDKWHHRIFFIPTSLESQVYHLTGKNIDFNNRDKLKETIKEFIQRCIDEEVDWFVELEMVLLT
jgi:hypothetical protein